MRAGGGAWVGVLQVAIVPDDNFMPAEDVLAAHTRASLRMAVEAAAARRPTHQLVCLGDPHAQQPVQLVAWRLQRPLEEAGRVVEPGGSGVVGQQPSVLAWVSIIGPWAVQLL